jgi:hypothetical protein
MTRRTQRVVAILAAAIAVAASECRRSSSGTGQPAAAVDTANAAPAIDSVRPDSAIVPRGAVVEVTIRGHGFAPGQPGMNTIHFGTVTLTHVPANGAGTELRFVIPDAIATGEAPPIPLQTGTYVLRVATQRGLSNPMTIRVFRE